MSVWFLLWILLSGSLLYFLGWTAFILYRQKKAWAQYARRNKLRYRGGALMASPEVSGTVGDYTVSLFTGEHISQDMRRTRKLAAIEVNLASRMPAEGGIASGDMVRLVQALGFKEEYRPKHESWQEGFIASGDSRAVLENYLTDERVKGLTALMKIKNTWIILLFRGDVMLLRLDTPEPLDDTQKIERIVKKMIEVAKVLELHSGEELRLKSAQSPRPEKEKSLPVDEGGLETGGLSLEEDASDKPEENSQ